MQPHINLQKARVAAYLKFAALSAALCSAAFVVEWLPRWLQVVAGVGVGYALFCAWADRSIQRKLERRQAAARLHVANESLSARETAPRAAGALRPTAPR